MYTRHFVYKHPKSNSQPSTTSSGTSALLLIHLTTSNSASNSEPTCTITTPEFEDLIDIREKCAVRFEAKQNLNMGECYRLKLSSR